MLLFDERQRRRVDTHSMNANQPTVSTRIIDSLRVIYRILQLTYVAHSGARFGGSDSTNPRRPGVVPAVGTFPRSADRFAAFPAWSPAGGETKFSLLTARGEADKLPGDCPVTRIPVDKVPRSSSAHFSRSWAGKSLVPVLVLPRRQGRAAGRSSVRATLNRGSAREGCPQRNAGSYVGRNRARARPTQTPHAVMLVVRPHLRARDPYRDSGPGPGGPGRAGGRRSDRAGRAARPGLGYGRRAVGHSLGRGCRAPGRRWPTRPRGRRPDPRGSDGERQRLPGRNLRGRRSPDLGTGGTATTSGTHRAADP